MEGQLDIHQIELSRLQALVTAYPWFSYAREVLLCKLVEIEPQCLESRYKENLVFFPRRDAVLLKCREMIARANAAQTAPVPVEELLAVAEGEDDGFEIDFDLIQQEAEEFTLDPDLQNEDLVIEEGETAEEEEFIPQPVKPKIFVVGGDYFSKEDFAQLQDNEKATDIKFGAPADNSQADIPQQFSQPAQTEDDLDFVTETLAAIYADQGYYEKAIEVYAKLILLYPEKSTYFATLVKEIKSKI